jgi:hypothetical protein
MTRLILTTEASGAGALKQAGLADIVVALGFNLVWGPPPPDAELASLFAPRTPGRDPAIPYWLHFLDRRRRGLLGREGLGLIELCELCDRVELWIDPVPNAQLMLIQLLDYLHSHAKAAPKLMLVQASVVLGNMLPDELLKWTPAAIEVSADHLKIASRAWQAYRQPTPQHWAALLDRDLSMLPQLGQAVLELLEELPMPATGLGATEMRLLELISVGGLHPYDVFPGYRKRNRRRVFGYWEVGSLLDGLARGAAPAVSGLNEGPFTEAMHDDSDRHARYKASWLSLTALGEKILARRADFSRHNQVHRWWGGTELTSHRLWRWDAANRFLIAP